jgi:ElaB/YqjD/DUF883 family membrane-anchored ribosome-binding protein
VNKTKKLDELVERVDALLTQFPDDAPGIVALREDLDKAILESWTAVARERAQARAAMDELAQSMSDVVRANRWMILGAVAAVAAAAGFIAARARRRIYP